MVWINPSQCLALPSVSRRIEISFHSYVMRTARSPLPALPARRAQAEGGGVSLCLPPGAQQRVDGRVRTGPDGGISESAMPSDWPFYFSTACHCTALITCSESFLWSVLRRQNRRFSFKTKTTRAKRPASQIDFSKDYSSAGFSSSCCSEAGAASSSGDSRSKSSA